MNVLIQLSHPAHFHLYKNVAKNLMEDGNKVLFVIKSKDILETLLQNAGLPYVNINQHAHRGSKLGILWDMFVREWRIIKLCRKHKIDLITGSTPETAHVSWLLRIHGINTGEDDAAVISMFIKIAKPFIDGYVAPDPCEMGLVEPKTIHYPGYHELAYLHPNHFTPSADVVRGYGIDVDQPYFVMRFASLNAHHDSGIKGINTEIAQRLINILEGSSLDHFDSASPSPDSPTGLDHFESSNPSAPSQLVPLSTNSLSNNSTKGTSLAPSEACSPSNPACSLPPSTCSPSGDSPSQLVPLSTISISNNSTKGTSYPSEACSLSPSACSPSGDSPSQLVPLSTNSLSNNSTKGTSYPSELAPQTDTAPSQLVPLANNSTNNSTSGYKPRIYITSERPLEPQFEMYRIKINPLDMHHVMAFASLYIGDSQTMAAEAGVLGVPFVRFTDFVGRIGYLRELEDVYELGYGIHASVLPADSPIRRNDGSLQPSGVEELYKRVEQLVTMPSAERRELFQQRRQQMLNDKIDCAKFLTYFIEQYPSSASEVKNATPDFWDRFK